MTSVGRWPPLAESDAIGSSQPAAVVDFRAHRGLQNLRQCSVRSPRIGQMTSLHIRSTCVGCVRLLEKLRSAFQPRFGIDGCCDQQDFPLTGRRKVCAFMNAMKSNQAISGLLPLRASPPFLICNKPHLSAQTAHILGGRPPCGTGGLNAWAAASLLTAAIGEVGQSVSR